MKSPLMSGRERRQKSIFSLNYVMSFAVLEQPSLSAYLSARVHYLPAFVGTDPPLERTEAQTGRSCRDFINSFSPFDSSL